MSRFRPTRSSGPAERRPPPNDAPVRPNRAGLRKPSAEFANPARSPERARRQVLPATERAGPSAAAPKPRPLSLRPDMTAKSPARCGHFAGLLLLLLFPGVFPPHLRPLVSSEVIDGTVQSPAWRGPFAFPPPNSKRRPDLHQWGVHQDNRPRTPSAQGIPGIRPGEFANARSIGKDARTLARWCDISETARGH